MRKGAVHQNIYLVDCRFSPQESDPQPLAAPEASLGNPLMVPVFWQKGWKTDGHNFAKPRWGNLVLKVCFFLTMSFPIWHLASMFLARKPWVFAGRQHWFNCIFCPMLGNRRVAHITLVGDLEVPNMMGWLCRATVEPSLSEKGVLQNSDTRLEHCQLSAAIP